MCQKNLILILFILINFSLQNSYKDNEELYRIYDPSYSNKEFNFHPIYALRGRSDFLNGLDCSMVSVIEENGGKYIDFDGKEKDFFKLIKEYGINLVRVRLWNDYNSKTGVKGGGCLDVERVLKLALRAKNEGLKFLLDFHYSDNWADPGKQTCPYSWSKLDFNGAREKLEQFTQNTIEYFISMGAKIDYVQVGNEINNGFMFPFGEIDWSDENTKKNTLDNVAILLNTAINAVKTSSPNTKIILHVGDTALETWHDEESGKDVPTGLYFFQQMEQRKVSYDIASVSFYLFNHHKDNDYLDMNTMTKSINQFIDSLKKPFMIMEYSMAYTLAPHQYAENQFGKEYSDLISREYPTSFQGQTNMIFDIAERVAKAKKRMGIGICYWGGEWLPVPGAGWGEQYITKASWSNQALFTYEGVATPTLAAMKVITQS